MGSYLAVLKSSHAFGGQLKVAGIGSALALAALLLASNAYSQVSPEPVVTAQVAGDAVATPSADSEQQLEANIRELDAIVLEKKNLESLLRTENSAYEAASLQAAGSKKMIRAELEEFLAQSASQERLDVMLGDFKREAEAENAARLRVASAQKKFNDQQLKFVLADRAVAQLKTRLATEQRERDMQRVRAIAQRLDKTIDFSESVSFHCSPSKSLAICLNEYDRGANLRQWVLSNYQRVLAEELRGQVATVNLSSDWFSYRSKSSFTQANMDLDGSVAATISFEASIEAKKMMACALLGVAEALCNSRPYALSIRSNKFNDRVLINDQLQGATPMSLMLDKGQYRVQVVSDGVTKSRTVNLEADKLINFKF